MGIKGLGTVLKKNTFTSVSAENIGAGDGSTTDFNGITLANHPVEYESLEISYTIGGTAYTATDDGEGVITGTDLSGTITYSTGAVDLTFTTAPDNATDITADYDYISETTTIAKVKSIGGPSMTKETRETTTLDSEGGYREYIGTFKDGGELSLTLEFDRTTYMVMLADYNSSSDTPLDYEIDLPDTDLTVFQFQGQVTGVPLTIAEDAVTYNSTIKVTGPVSVYKQL